MERNTQIKISEYKSMSKKIMKVIIVILLVVLAVFAILFAIPKTGIRCRLFGHDIYQEVVEEPSCGASGVARVKCSVCKKTLDVVQISSTGEHKFKDGVCTVCGEKDPEYTPIIVDTDDDTNTPVIPADNGQGYTGPQGGSDPSGTETPEDPSAGGAHINENGDIVLPELP